MKQGKSIRQKAPVKSLNDLKIQRDNINQEINKLKQTLMPPADMAINASTKGFRIVHLITTAVGAAKIAMTGYRVYKNIVGFISRFRK